MKLLANVLIVVGLLLIATAVVGRLVGDPGFFFGRRVISMVVGSNTALLLAILAKLSEKK